MTLISSLFFKSFSKNIKPFLRSSKKLFLCVMSFLSIQDCNDMILCF